MKKYLLAHDLGTSGDKATLFDIDGHLVTSTSASYDSFYQNSNWAEQNPEDWWKAVCVTTGRILERIDADDIASVCFSGQMMGCLPVDSAGNPLRNHILYSDQRSSVQTETLVEKIGQKEIYRITGHRPSPSYSIEKMMWIRDNEPDIYKNTFKFLNAKDYMNFRLTGRITTDYNDASGTNAFDLHSLEWSDAIIDAVEIDRDKFPEAGASTEVIGEITRQAAEATGLRAGTPVVAGAGDGGCATIGIGSVRPGITYNYIGSSSWISTTSSTVLDDPEMRNFTWAHPIPGYLQPCGTMQTAGSAFAWMKKELGAYESEQAGRNGKDPYDILNSLVADSPAGAGGVIFLPYLLGERSPRWNPDAKGAFLGLTLEHSRADLFRSVLEGITVNLGIILDVMKKEIDISEIRLIGGGAKSPQWQQIMADVYGIPIVVPQLLDEATSMGAAVIGGVGTGALKNFDRVEDFIEFIGRKEPSAENTAKYGRIREVFDKAYNALAPIFDELKTGY